MMADRQLKQDTNAERREQAVRHAGVWAMTLVAGIFAQSAIAQSIHKYVWPDGRIIYSNEPVPGARRIGTVEVPPAPGRKAVEAAQARSAEAERQDMQQSVAREIARQRVEDAITELERARRALARASEVRSETADGGAGLPAAPQGGTRR